MLQQLSGFLCGDALVFLALTTLAHIIVEVAVMSVYRSVIHLQNLIAHPVEKIAVVGHHKQCHVRLGEVILKPFHHLHVEVVGRLVKEKHVRVV